MVWFMAQECCGTRSCDLCLPEKMIVALADPKVLLNKRTELISKCRHKSKFILNSVKKKLSELTWQLLNDLSLTC